MLYWSVYRPPVGKMDISLHEMAETSQYCLFLCSDIFICVDLNQGFPPFFLARDHFYIVLVSRDPDGGIIKINCNNQTETLIKHTLGLGT